MKSIEVTLSGLMTVVRERAGAETVEEPMTIVYPRGDFSDAMNGRMSKHRPVMYIHKDVLKQTGGKGPACLKPLRAPNYSPPGYKGFHLAGWDLHLPAGEGVPAPVRHALDQQFLPPQEPTSCAALASFASLSMLPDLNDLTGSDFEAANLNTPAPKLVQSRVKLYGGALRGCVSKKPLKHAFFEFYSWFGSVAIQPAVEDVVYSVDSADGYLTLGFSKIDGSDGGNVQTYRFPAVVDMPLQVSSLPGITGTPVTIGTDSLRHFSMYYALMTAPTRHPLVRMLARGVETWDVSSDGTTSIAPLASWPIVHTAPDFHLTADRLNSIRFRHLPSSLCSPVNCACLASQASVKPR